MQIKGRIWTLVFIIVITGLFFSLASWQLFRGLDKAQRAQTIANVSHTNDLAKLSATGAELAHVRLTLKLAKRSQSSVWLQDNMLNQQRLGVDVWQIAQVGQPQQNILVRLGWLPLNQHRLPEGFIAEEARSWEVTGVLTKPADNPFIRALVEQRQGWTLIGEPDIALVQKHQNKPLSNFVFYPDKADTGLQNRKYQVNQMTPDRHFAYALQWILIACAWLIVSLWAVNTRGKHAG
ncbi:SURF1 family protein [Gayadomonas joobiniege]|uniref:SURF1 family protein n=1 Tax=Gayadomonas joobiniege TaxID=1234606 RepID=UPI00035EF941|nr:SURF1 family protein [Gayadomonas joobiniege]